MISVLIPVYNYSAIPLVETLHKQLEASKISYEIIVWDDASNETINLQNKIINHVPNIHYFRSQHHCGVLQTRKLLADKAMFNWLLFVDADTLPKQQDYIQNYATLIPQNYDAIFGGISYGKEAPKNNLQLRWKYGRTKEAIDTTLRNKQPYKLVNFSNFLIKRTLYITLHPKLKDLGFYSNNYFGSVLKAHQTNVFHTHNDVYQLGIDSNAHFLSKIKKGIDALVKCYQNQDVDVQNESLLRSLSNLKRKGLEGLFATVYKKFHLKMEANLLGQNPSLKLLRMYEITYLCYQNKNTINR